MSGKQKQSKDYTSVRSERQSKRYTSNFLGLKLWKMDLITKPTKTFSKN